MRCPSNRGTARRRVGNPARIGSGNGSADGSPGIGPASSDSNNRTSAIDVASGPNVERSIQSGMGSRPITPFVGLSPARPQNAAGIRMEPPPSVAVAIAAMPAASAAPEPPLDPPGDQSVPHGFVVVPYSAFVVNPANANSGWFVLPTTIAPAARNLRGTSPSTAAGGASASVSEPNVDGIPVTFSMSFTRSGSPASAPGSSPAAIRSSIARASSTASSRMRITALSGVFRRSIRSRDMLDQLSGRRPAGADRRREVREVHRCVTMSRMRTKLGLRFRSFSTTVDALRPGTPITPPPGCVPPPQR